ncbi:SDR family NAD(P)-dependent oxidoreductase [Pseudahrensia aquimaris]|uniref:SDR family NAD(P)-dependent oxidoreductase n=1 Tax=Pseudahrensia aquimaris TaxID=744461 RepID=A0ABW3FCF4_9HYPH
MSGVIGKRVLITGATDGIGLAMACKYAQAGARVLATGRRPLARTDDIFGGATLTYIRADQSEPEEAARSIVQTMKTMGWTGCDLAILNAGIGWAGNPADEPAEVLAEQVAVNVESPVQIARAIAPALFEAKGQLTLIGSIAHKGSKKFATYAATKAAQRGLARSLREEWRDRANVQILHPGAIRTGMHAKAGFKAGMFRIFFTGSRRASNAILSAIESGVAERVIKRNFIFRTGWRTPRRLRKVQ